jgi:putative oxidoreductase
MSAELLIVRVVFGSLFAAHGAQKLFGSFGEGGLSKTGTAFESIGFHPGRLFALADGLAEFVGGLLFAFGLLVPIAAAAMVSVMLVAVVAVHWGNGLLTATNGVELPLLYSATAVSVALAGPGQYSLDARLGLSSWWTAEVTMAALVIGIGGAAASLMLRRSRT